jgi:hypothetical protein
MEVQSKAQAASALAMHTWIDVPIKVTPHRSLNVSRGVIRCRDFRDCDDDEILDALRSQGVTSVKHIMAKRDGKIEPTNTIILTFNVPVAPNYVRAAYQKIAVDTYIPNPLRCYNCQKFGHGKTNCNRHAVCARCGKEGHQDSECQDPPKCANCSGDHPAFSKECPEWLKQKEVTTTKFQQNITFREARQIVEQRVAGNGCPSTALSSCRAGMTYAQATRSVRAAATQTDITWPLESEKPVRIADCDSSNDPRAQQTEQTTQTIDTVRSEEGAVGGSVAVAAGATAATSSGQANQPRSSAGTRAASNESSKTGNKPGPASSKNTNSNRPIKGASDPVRLYNKYSSLDEMELDLAPAPTTRKGPPKTGR